MTSCPDCGAYLLAGDAARCPFCLRPIRAMTAAVPTSPWEVGEADLLPGTDEAFDGPDEAIFRQACDLVRAPEPKATIGPLWLGFSLLLFLASRGNNSIQQVAIVVGVLFLHEAGHWLGMQAFGYRDMKMFFIPFFGAAVSGKKEEAPQWQRAIVSLLGPLPGIALGCALLVWTRFTPNPTVRLVAWWLIGINVFNLLPFEPLDGGRFLHAVVFSRHRALEAIFVASTSLAMIGLGLGLGQWIPAVLGVLGLILVPARYRTARAADAVVRRWGRPEGRAAGASEPLLRDIFAEVRNAAISKTGNAAANYARMIRDVHERAALRPVPAVTSLGLVVAYAAGFAMPVVTFVAMPLLHR